MLPMRSPKQARSSIGTARPLSVGQTTVATYEVGYQMPEVLVRGLIGAALADDFENAGEASLRQLDALIEDDLSN